MVLFSVGCFLDTSDVQNIGQSQDEAFWKANCNSAYASCKVFNPSGALVKALLINSGEPMAKYVGTETTVLDTQDLPAPPDYFQVRICSAAISLEACLRFCS